MERGAVHATERGTRFAETLGRAGFEDLEAEAATLSGGWQKRLAIVEALVQAPDILLLDEPTNHLDLAGIEWLEELLAQAAFASVIVSHDRYFLENVATDMAELSRVYPDGFCACAETTARFWRRKKNFCTRNRSGRKRWKIWSTTRLSGCGAGPRRARGSPRRASAKPMN